jgi:acetyl-CoA acetyltransferase family protein
MTEGGGLSATGPMELTRQTLDGLIARTGIDPSVVDRVLVQCGDALADHLEVSGGLTWPMSGLPARVPAMTIDRWCGTGQEILHHAARSVVSGRHDVVVAIGVEWAYPRKSEAGTGAPSASKGSKSSATVEIPRVLAAELLAAAKGIDRAQLDAYAARSNRRAGEVAAAGEFLKEIVPVTVHDGRHCRRVERDELIPNDATIEMLSKLRPILEDPAVITRHPEISCSITPGNSARRAVGASATLLMTQQRANQLGVQPRARVHQLAVSSGDAEAPLVAPLRATQKILTGAQMSVSQLDHVEVDEEFACVPLAWRSEFPIDSDLFNPRGGALALGNPRACGGLRQLTTMLAALDGTGGHFGLQTMSANGDLAYALLVERC